MAAAAGIAVHHGNLPPSPMRCACIDIGSNTTRLLVADVDSGRLGIVIQEREFTRIGKRIDAAGVIPDATVEAVADVVAGQRSSADRAGARHVRVVATAAIRCAANRDELLAAVRERAGLAPVILSGDDEARLAFAGATRTMPAPPDGTIAVVDVGGMSTEIAVGTMAAGVTWCRSFDVGSGSLAGRCASDPPSPADMEAMRAEAAEAFAVADIPRPDTAVAVGGSAASLPTIVGPVLDDGALERALGVLTAAPAAEVARRHALAAERAHLLPAGILVLDAAAQRLGMPLRIGRGGLREGVILELAERH
jgi:exopolyphosphatase / guanosine-5'-triphosphate,3'-diphosphate pyrophosphatase